MKKLLSKVLPLVLLGLTVIYTGCTDNSTLPEVEQVETVAVHSLTATTPSGENTKVNLQDNHSGTINVTWNYSSVDSEIDRISIFNRITKQWVANYKYKGRSYETTGDFAYESGETNLPIGDYVAVYPAVESTMTLDERDNMPTNEDYTFSSNAPELSDRCRMRAEFSVNETTEKIFLGFTHEMAILKVHYYYNAPLSMTVRDGEAITRDYRVNFPADSNPSIIYLMIKPNSGGAPRELLFAFKHAQPKDDYVFKVTISKAYEAGYFYTADLRPSDLASNGIVIENYCPIFRGTDLESYRDAFNENPDGNTYGATVKLMNDITLTKDWTTIGSFSQPFNERVFDGQSHSISNMKIVSTANYQGLIGYVGYGATVKNVTLIAPDITGGDMVGGIAGDCISHIENCGVIGGSIVGNEEVGGIVGLLAPISVHATLTGCYSSASVSGHSYVGGVVGYAYGIPNNGQENFVTVAGCYSTGIVSDLANAIPDLTSVNGVVGRAKGSRIYSCFSTGYISGTATSEPYTYTGVMGNNGSAIQDSESPYSTQSNYFYTPNNTDTDIYATGVTSYSALNAEVSVMNVILKNYGYSPRYTANTNSATAPPTLRGEVL